jgi:hypothetical protein
MALLTPPPAAPQRGDRTTFAARVDAFITWLINFVSELLALVSNLNSVAAGGAYALPYKWGVTVNASIGFSAGGFIGLYDGINSNVMAQPASATTLYLDTKDSSGASTYALLPSLTSGNTSAVKGHVRLVKLGDPSKWARFSILSFTQNSALYNSFTIAFIDASDAAPFSTGDAVLAYFQRTGDKGDTGPAGFTPTYMYVRDEKSNGVGGGVAANGATVRTLNTVKVNTISGASLASNAVTLPAGTYEYVGSVPGYQCNAFQGQLWNSTDSVQIDVGTSETSTASSGAQARSVVRGTFTITSAKVFQLRHLQVNGGAGTFGQAASNANSVVEVYAEILFRKIA